MKASDKYEQIKNCPFCGDEAITKNIKDNVWIIGCDTLITNETEARLHMF